MDLGRRITDRLDAGLPALREGTSTTQELIDAQLNQAKVQTERAQAAYEYIKALAELLEASGQGDAFERYMARANTKVE